MSTAGTKVTGEQVRWGTAKRLAASVLCHPYTGRAIGALWGNRIPGGGGRIEVVENGDPRVNAMIYWGLYESAEIRCVRRYVDSDVDVIELGASLGVVSCQIALRLSGDRRLVCVEANEALLPILRRNVANNTRKQNIRFVHGAIDYGGSASVGFVVGADNLTARVAPAGSREHAVPAVTLANVLDAAAIGDYVLVADIEGAEAGMFSCDGDALARCRRMIVELHESVYGGTTYAVDDLIAMVHRNTRLRLRDRYGPVCVFDQAA